MSRSLSIHLVTSGTVHPTLFGQVALRNALRDAVQFPVSWERGAGSLASIGARESLCTVVSFHRPAPDKRLLAALSDYVRGGGRLVGIHGVTASLKGEPGYAEIWGAAFAGHDPFGPMLLAAVDPDRPIVTLREEGYRHQFVRDVEVWYRWSRGDGTGPGEPAVWTTRHGSGRVAYLMCGHRAGVWRNPGVRSILSRLVAWCVSEDER